MKAGEGAPDTYGAVVNLPIADGEEDWRLAGLCAETDPELFFSEKGSNAGPAKKVCRRCDVQAECLEFALLNNIQFGVWGATGPSERRILRRAAGN